MHDEIGSIVHAWAHKHGFPISWRPDYPITYTRSRGAWVVATFEGDQVAVHPAPHGGAELQKDSSAGHLEVLRVDLEELRCELDGMLAWFHGWRDFMSQGPGKGH